MVNNNKKIRSILRMMHSEQLIISAKLKNLSNVIDCHNFQIITKGRNSIENHKTNL